MLIHTLRLELSVNMLTQLRREKTRQAQIFCFMKYFTDIICRAKHPINNIASNSPEQLQEKPPDSAVTSYLSQSPSDDVHILRHLLDGRLTETDCVCWRKQGPGHSRAGKKPIVPLENKIRYKRNIILQYYCYCFYIYTHRSVLKWVFTKKLYIYKQNCSYHINCISKCLQKLHNQKIHK